MEDVVDEEAVGDDHDKEAGDKEEPKVPNPDLGFGLGGQKWEGFFSVHINSKLIPSLLLRFQNLSKSFSSVRIVFTHAELHMSFI